MSESKMSIKRATLINSAAKYYNVVCSFAVNIILSRILSPDDVTPTLVAMDMASLGVVDNGGLRHLSIREGLRLFGYPDWYDLSDFSKTQKGIDLGYDLLGNTVCVPVIESVSEKLAESWRSFNGKTK